MLSDKIVEGKSWWKTCLIGCLLFIVAIFVGGYLLFRFLFGPADKLIISLPENYPEYLMPYKPSEVRTMRFSSGQNRSKIMSILTAPVSLVAGLGDKMKASSTEDTESLQNAVGLISASLSNKDTITIIWSDLESDKKEVLDYYSALAKTAKMTEKTYRDEATGTDFLGAQKTDSMFQLYLQDLPDTPLLDKIILVVEYNVKK